MLIGSSAHSLAPQAHLVALRHAHLPMHLHLRRDQTVAESYNWSGYAVTGATGSVSDVKASWIVPTATCSATPDGYAAFWVGIDGWTSSTVEQTGTDSDCVNLTGTQAGTPTYYAWFEFYPAGAFLVGTYNSSGVCESDCVAPGDVMSAEVKFNGSGSRGRRGGRSFTATITDETRGWTFSTTSTVSGAQESSAEWIAEAPAGCNTASTICPLSDFNSVDFGSSFTGIANTSFATVSGTTQALGSFGSSIQEAVMVSDPAGVVKAQPSAIEGSGTSFSVTWASEGP